jgi:hypothetical protein
MYDADLSSSLREILNTQYLFIENSFQENIDLQTSLKTDFLFLCFICCSQPSKSWFVCKNGFDWLSLLLDTAPLVESSSSSLERSDFFEFVVTR